MIVEILSVIRVPYIGSLSVPRDFRLSRAVDGDTRRDVLFVMFQELF